MATLVTYRVVASHLGDQDLNPKLERSAAVACNFWNRFVIPATNIVVRLQVRRADANVIAVANAPFPSEGAGTSYGAVYVNPPYLRAWSDERMAGTIIHEIGHILGIGQIKWKGLFSKASGEFTSRAVAQLPTLRDMRIDIVASDRHTRYSHWDEGKFGGELMTGFKDDAEHVLPETIAVMRLLGHEVREELRTKRLLADLVAEAGRATFTQQDLARAIDRDFFKRTRKAETIFASRSLPEETVPQRVANSPAKE